MNLINEKNTMNLSKRISQFVEIVKTHLKNDHLTDDVSYYAFLLSLLPFPGIQQASQVIDRIFADESLKNRLGNIWQEINSTNSRIATIEDEIERLQEIATTVKYNSDLDKEVAGTVNQIIADIENYTEWNLETEDWSFQSVLDSIVEAEIVQIVSNNNSTNSIKDTEIRAKKTILRATNNSNNHVENTNFNTGSGNLGMDGISASGDISIGNGIESLGRDAGIGIMGGPFTRLGPGSSLQFVGNPILSIGTCSLCRAQIQVDTRSLAGGGSIVCPNCKGILTIG